MLVQIHRVKSVRVVEIANLDFSDVLRLEIRHEGIGGKEQTLSLDLFGGRWNTRVQSIEAVYPVEEEVEA